MELLKAYLKERRLTLAAFLLFVGVFAVSFALYGLPLAAVGYPAGLCVLLGACLAAWDYGRAARRHKALKRLREAGEAVLLDLPAMTTVEGGGLRRRGGDAAAGTVPAGDGARRPVGGYDGLLHRMGAPDQDANRRYAPDPAG